ncbi:MAG TPA: hypothetical protein VMT52_08125 [Planctomycetota bacterium]|nr:hypothetical protein [Planctomycetota bacterium]
MGPRVRKLIKTAIIVAGLALVLALAGVYFIRDSDPPEDADLRVQVVALPAASNGLLHLAEGVAEIDWPGDALPEGDDEAEALTIGIAMGGTWDAKFAGDVLARNRAVLERFDRSLAMPGFQAPPMIAGEESSVTYLWSWRKLFLLASIRIWDRLAVGDDAGGLREAVQALRFARRCEDAGGPIIHYLVATALEGWALANLGRAVTGARLEPARLKDLLGEVEKLEPGPGLLRKVVWSEYAFGAHSIEATARGDLPIEPDLVFGSGQSMPVWPWRSRLFYLPNDTKRLVAELCRETLNAVPPEGPWRPVDWSLFESIEPNRWFPGRNGIGRHGMTSAVFGYRSVVERYQTSRLQFLFLRSIIALRGFRATQGRLPDRLGELVPEWIAEVPKDPFDGSALRYDPQRRVIWSVGSDGIDQGGTFEPDPENPQLDLTEPTAKIPFE